MIVLPDADIEMAADAAVSAAYGSAGERCMAISALVAVGSVADPLVEAIRERLPKIKVGPGSDPASEMGPLVTREHRDKVASYLDSGKAQGAERRRRRAGATRSTGADGFFLGVSLIDHVTPEMDCYRDEIFGPVLTVVRVDTYDEALKLINDNPYGNGTAIFTRDGGAARQFQFDVNAGMVGVNVPIPVPVAYYSFGGWKASLFGDLHMYGPDGIQFYTRTKVVTERWPDPGTLEGRPGLPADALTGRRRRHRLRPDQACSSTMLPSGIGGVAPGDVAAVGGRERDDLAEPATAGRDHRLERRGDVGDLERDVAPARPGDRRPGVLVERVVAGRSRASARSWPWPGSRRWAPVRWASRRPVAASRSGPRKSRSGGTRLQPKTSP